MQTNSKDYVIIEKVFNYIKENHVGNLPEIITGSRLPPEHEANDLYRIQSKLLELDIIVHESNGLSGFNYYNLSVFGIKFSNGRELVKHIKDSEGEELSRRRREIVTFKLSIWSFIVSIIAIIISSIAIILGL